MAPWFSELLSHGPISARGTPKELLASLLSLPPSPPTPSPLPLPLDFVPRQAIYGWRGAKPVCLQRYLDIDYEAVHDLQLRFNYRSQAHILSLSSRLMRHSQQDRAVGRAGGTLSQVATRVSEGG